MEPTLESTKSGGGSIKVGSTGKISALMSKELNSTKPPSRPNVKTPSDESSSSRSTNTSKYFKGPENTKKTKTHTRSTTQVPMLAADDNISIDGTPIRKSKPVKKGNAGVVEIVDIKCGSSDRKWVNPITDRLKKLSFSKLSESVV